MKRLPIILSALLLSACAAISGLPERSADLLSKRPLAEHAFKLMTPPTDKSGQALTGRIVALLDVNPQGKVIGVAWQGDDIPELRRLAAKDFPHSQKPAQDCTTRNSITTCAGVPSFSRRIYLFPDKAKIYKPEGFVPTPYYPFSLQADGEEGNVVLSVTIDPQGLPRQVKIVESSGYPRLDRVATSTVLQRSQFVPGVKNGQGEWTRFTIPIRFSLEIPTVP